MERDSRDIYSDKFKAVGPTDKEIRGAVCIGFNNKILLISYVMSTIVCLCENVSRDKISEIVSGYEHSSDHSYCSLISLLKSINISNQCGICEKYAKILLIELFVEKYGINSASGLREFIEAEDDISIVNVAANTLMLLLIRREEDEL